MEPSNWMRWECRCMVGIDAWEGTWTRRRDGSRTKTTRCGGDFHANGKADDREVGLHWIMDFAHPMRMPNDTLTILFLASRATGGRSSSMKGTINSLARSSHSKKLAFVCTTIHVDHHGGTRETWRRTRNSSGMEPRTRVDPHAHAHQLGARMKRWMHASLYNSCTSIRILLVSCTSAVWFRTFHQWKRSAHPPHSFAFSFLVLVPCPTMHGMFAMQCSRISS
mmetsp:Transcript_5041/g.32083  ORF Transcript_5041/g.32083 Transcript_5041/m.32083 type:complete len:223 (-) Transcript_5041:124-792(-)